MNRRIELIMLEQMYIGVEIIPHAIQLARTNYVHVFVAEEEEPSLFDPEPFLIKPVEIFEPRFNQFKPAKKRHRQRKYFYK